VTMSGLVVAMLLAMLDNMIVAPALPTIVGELGGLNHLAWVTTGYVLASTAGDRMEVPKTGDRYDTVELRNKLQERHRLEPNRRDLIVAPEDGVEYMFVVEAMDVVVGEGYPDMTLSDGASL